MTGTKFDAARGELTLGGSRLVFHCHHFNVFLQRSLEDALGERAYAIQRDAACESARVMLSRLFDEESVVGYDARMRRAVEVFAMAGFGRATLIEVSPMKAQVEVSPSHYAIGWIAKFGPAKHPVDHFATGYFRGAHCAATGFASERVTVEVTSEAAAGDGAATVIQIGVR
jgi:hypothetical protein